MIETQRKEELSVSYLKALCAYGVADMDIHNHDDDGYDGSIRKVIPFGQGKFSAQIEFQLKSTSTQLRDDNDTIHYDLKAKNYRDLIRPGTCQSYLFLFVLPQNEVEWLTVTPENLILRKCMYWLSLKDFDEKDNKDTITIYIPKTNILTAEKINELLQQATEGDE